MVKFEYTPVNAGREKNQRWQLVNFQQVGTEQNSHVGYGLYNGGSFPDIK